MAEGKVAFSGPVTHALEFFKRYILLNCNRTMIAGDSSFLHVKYFTTS